MTNLWVKYCYLIYVHIKVGRRLICFVISFLILFHILFSMFFAISFSMLLAFCSRFCLQFWYRFDLLISDRLLAKRTTPVRTRSVFEPHWSFRAVSNSTRHFARTRNDYLSIVDQLTTILRAWPPIHARDLPTSVTEHICTHSRTTTEIPRNLPVHLHIQFL